MPIYAKIIDNLTPCDTEKFACEFNIEFSKYVSEDKRIKKTLDNHRTEIAGKLFGMFYEDDYGYVYASERTKKFVEDADQPAFFKDICFKMQFPNGMQKIQTLQPMLDNSINIRPNSFVLKVLEYAKNAGITLHKREIGYYILNSLDVLRGTATPLEVIEALQNDLQDGIERVIKTEGKAPSFNYQHINEQINYLELANLVYTNKDGEIWLNDNEKNTIKIFSDTWNQKPEFDVYSYDLSKAEGRKQFQQNWNCYFGKLSLCVDRFITTAESLGIGTKKEDAVNSTSHQTTVEIGDEGEAFVFKFEKDRVGKFNPRLVNKVLSLGKTKGLGYDIQSVIAEKGEMEEFVKYIEVKSTKRVTAPNMPEPLWADSLNITRNEWIAAKQHQDFYYIYRVYFIRGSVLLYVINNIHKKEQDGIISIVPLTYRIDFGKDAVDQVIVNEVKNNV